jgi:hypothetical protein
MAFINKCNNDESNNLSSILVKEMPSVIFLTYIFCSVQACPKLIERFREREENVKVNT